MDGLQKNINGMVINTKMDEFEKHKMLREKSVQINKLTSRIEILEKQVKYLYEQLSREN